MKLSTSPHPGALRVAIRYDSGSSILTKARLVTILTTVLSGKGPYPLGAEQGPGVCHFESWCHYL